MSEGKEAARAVRKIEFITPSIDVSSLSPEKQEELRMESELATIRLREKEGEMIIKTKNMATGMEVMTGNMLSQHEGGLGFESEATFESPGINIRLKVGNTEGATKGYFSPDKNRTTLLTIAGLIAIVAIVYILANGHV